MAEKTKVTDFALRRFTAGELDATEADWLAKTPFPPEISQIMSYTRDHQDEAGGELAYGVFRKGEKVASGICEIVVTRQSARSKWVKLLRMRLHPTVDAAIQESDVDATTAALHMFGAAVTGALRLKLSHAATILKIYGRSNEQRKFLAYLGVEVTKSGVPFKAAMEGPFLVVSNK